MTKDMEKAEVLRVFFALVSTDKISLWELQAPVTSGKGQSKEDQPLVGKDQVKKCLEMGYEQIYGTHP